MPTPPTNASSTPASPPASSPPEPAEPPGICAIHQPNLLPRLTTLAKIYTADCWIVLDDVQFNRRDYQHRTRLARLHDPGRQQWLTLATTLPTGRATLIRHARLADPGHCRRRLRQMTHDYYRTSPAWDVMRHFINVLDPLFDSTDMLSEITEASTLAMLRLLGWNGTVIRSSRLHARSGRSQRLADLTAEVGATTYLCGTGGMRYLDPTPFQEASITVLPFRRPDGPIWEHADRITSMWPVLRWGPQAIKEELNSSLARVSGR
ncbi:WbqC family protein [Catenuloplanes sp. NPDC051500]|uniref:WbqC family protein n=1 Tax=Catenuloplanes sp. NPDC051500 TaxID=3363959 RepID=UPI0037B7C918